MSTEAVAAANDSIAVASAPAPAADAEIKDQIKCANPPATAFLHSPPDSNNTVKSDASDSELSDLEEEPAASDAPRLASAADDAPEEDDIGEVLPDHWSGTVPVFKPEMRQFKDFKRFMEKVDSYGMKSGIIKIIPPQEWKDSLPELDELVKRVKVREPIKQDIMGSNGTYRQVNFLHGRSYNIPQWRQLCEQSEHQPPARRGERRANADKPRVTRARAAAAPKPTSTGIKKRGRGRPPKNKGKGKSMINDDDNDDDDDRPMTPVSPHPEAAQVPSEPITSIEKDPGETMDDRAATPTVGRMGGSRQAKAKVQSTSARRKFSRREGSAMIDEESFKDFDYRMDISEYTPERCEELERAYWKTLTYAQPLYGADLMGTLFDEGTELWNLNKLPNLLDVLGTKVPGVNTAYLYLGMWKATFAWHLEDVDLYSINYLHFGAPKQWYSISQADARRFEAAMKSVWPTDAKACDQFLRHKAFLISPQHLLSNYGIKVNKCVSYPGEFVVTYPYGYHSGYNLGYNCAEAVNFALDSWLDMGKIAKKCECAQAQDSVWVDVYEIERKLRGESTEYEETDDEEDEDEMSGLPTPPASYGIKFGSKRKRGPGEKGRKMVKKIKLRIRTKADPPCCLCPNDFPAAELLPTDDGLKAHRMCALYLPETYIETVDDQEVVFNISRVHKDRRDLKCLYCRSKRGACFQCSQKKCARAYHATCAHAAGVFVEEEEVPVFGEDGTEYKEQAFQFSCRFHRAKRDKKIDGESLEGDARVQAAAAALKESDICQLQYLRGEIFAGVVVENRSTEQTLVVDVIPNGDRLEVEWKWLRLPDPADYHLPKASANALPMPTSRKDKDRLNAKRQDDDKPRKDDIFAEGYTWAEFNSHDAKNKDQVKVDFVKQDQIWHYIGKNSTETKAQYTEDPLRQEHNPRSNFLDTVPKPPRPAPLASVSRHQSYGATIPYGGQPYPMGVTGQASMQVRPEKPYVYKPRKPVEPQYGSMATFTAQRFAPMASPSPAPQGPPYHNQHQYGSNPGLQQSNAYSVHRFEVKPPSNCAPGSYHSPSPAPLNAAPAPAQHQQPQPGYQQWQKQQQQWQQPAAATSRPPQAYSMPAPAPVSFPQGSAPLPASVSQVRAPLQEPAQARPQTNHQWHVHSSIYQKYPFFQVHHNKDSSKHLTPYGAYGGFINGYQGNWRAHMMENQGDLLRRPSYSSMSPSQTPNQGAGPQNAYSPGFSTTTGGISQPPSTSNPGQYTANPAQHRPPVPTPPVPAPQRQLPPAIKAQYLPADHASMLSQKSQQSVFSVNVKTTPVPKSKPRPRAKANPTPGAAQLPAPTPALVSTYTTAMVPAPASTGIPEPSGVKKGAVSKPAQSAAPRPTPDRASGSSPAPAQRSYKIPLKESPVPLPANFLAAMVSFPATPMASPARKSRASTPKSAKTPVPVPRVPGMSTHLATTTNAAVLEKAGSASSGSAATSMPVQERDALTKSPQHSQAEPKPTEGHIMPAQSEGQPNFPKATKALKIKTTGLGVPSTQPALLDTTDQKSSGSKSRAQLPQPTGFPDVPGRESMEFVERMVENLRKMSQQDHSA